MQLWKTLSYSANMRSDRATVGSHRGRAADWKICGLQRNCKPRHLGNHRTLRLEPGPARRIDQNGRRRAGKEPVSPLRSNFVWKSRKKLVDQSAEPIDL